MDPNKILFPYNFTDMDKKALDFIVHTYAAHQNARVTIFHVYAQIPDVILNKNTVMEKMAANLNYLRHQIQEQEGRIKEVLQQLLSGGFRSDQVDYYYQPRKMDIAREIIQLARDKAYKTIVLNRSGNITGFFKAEVFSRVITSLKDVTITIVT